LMWMSLADIHDHYGAFAAASKLLEQIEGRGPVSGRTDTFGSSAPEGSAFLEGRSISVAGAALQQRVTNAVTKTGGNVLSTQLDLEASRSKSGFINLIVSCELSQPALQQVLYDLEAGMPFLFIEQLQAQAPQAVGRDSGPLRVVMTVVGKWQPKQ
jgi:general secretion pathway protein M